MNQVYRGIAGMKLPDEFWEANDYGVKGGVEPAFMSTTLNRDVAMGYAASDSSRMGLVLEVRQGKVAGQKGVLNGPQELHASWLPSESRPQCSGCVSPT